jgi:hypothetical protein
MKKYIFLILFFLSFGSVLHAQLPNTAYVLDNFNDGNYNANPAWSAVGGPPSASSFALVTNSSSISGMYIYTGFSTACKEWSISVKANNAPFTGISNNDLFQYYFILKDNFNPGSGLADGYFLQYDGQSGDFFIFRQDNGTRAPTPVLSYTTLGSNDLTHSVKITLSTSGVFELFVNNVSQGIGSDAAYASCETQYQAIRIVDQGSIATYTIDNISYVTSSCVNPSNGGTIASSQFQCAGFDPAEITQSVAPSCNFGGTLQYQWQVSTQGPLSGFSDIVGENNVTYNPGPITKDAHYKRLTKVSCAAEWVESNVVSATTTFKITGSPLDVTVFSPTGSGVFGVEVNISTGLSYQWEFSIDGVVWSAVSAGPTYSITIPAEFPNRCFLQVNNPALAMNGYKYRCKITSSLCPSLPLTTKVVTLTVVNQLTAGSTQTNACGSWTNQLDIPITVGGVGTLNTTTSTLRQINLHIGSGSCRKNLSSYDFTLIGPEGGSRSLKFIDNFTSVSNNVWAKIKFRDHSALEKISEYDGQASYFPYSYGYYAIENDNTLASTFSGMVADGQWTLRIEQTGGSANAISFTKAELIFGPDFVEKDVTGNSINNACALATCMGADQNIIIGTNIGYSGNDPNYPGHSPTFDAGGCGGNNCEWNAANNSSAWFYFFATSTSSYITVSGLATTSPGVADMQLMVLDGGNGCLSTGWSIPAGGCLDDESACPSNPKMPNNHDYYASTVIATSSGGTATAGQIYFNGITFNTEFKLSGLTVGRRYLLVLDGNGLNNSSFYIELESGAANCIFGGVLPVKYFSFNAAKYGSKNQLIWKTSEEINNDYFQVERSSDGREWSVLQSIEGAGRESRTLRAYEVFDDAPLIGANYYRIKQVSSDDSYTYSQVRKIMNDGDQSVSIYPNPGKGIFTLSGLEKGITHHIQLMDVTGKVIKSMNTSNDVLQIPMHDAAPGVYYIRVDGKSNLKFVNME